MHSYSACKNISKRFEALPCCIQSKVIEISDSCLLPLAFALPDTVTPLAMWGKTEVNVKIQVFLHSSHILGAQLASGNETGVIKQPRFCGSCFGLGCLLHSRLVAGFMLLYSENKLKMKLWEGGAEG